MCACLSVCARSHPFGPNDFRCSDHPPAANTEKGDLLRAASHGVTGQSGECFAEAQSTRRAAAGGAEQQEEAGAGDARRTPAVVYANADYITEASANADDPTDANADADAYADLIAFFNANADGDLHAIANADADTNADTDAYADIKTDTDTNVDTDANADANEHIGGAAAVKCDGGLAAAEPYGTAR